MYAFQTHLRRFGIAVTSWSMCTTPDRAVSVRALAWDIVLCSYRVGHSTFTVPLFTRPRLFKGWITLSTGEIAIQRISVDKTNHAIRWIVIYPMDSVIRFSNNRGLVYKWVSSNLELERGGWTLRWTAITSRGEY